MSTVTSSSARVSTSPLGASPRKILLTRSRRMTGMVGSEGVVPAGSGFPRSFVHRPISHPPSRELDGFRGRSAHGLIRTSQWWLPDSRKRSEEHTSELQSLRHLVCRFLLDKKNLI